MDAPSAHEIPSDDFSSMETITFMADTPVAQENLESVDQCAPHDQTECHRDVTSAGVLSSHSNASEEEPSLLGVAPAIVLSFPGSPISPSFLAPQQSRFNELLLLLPRVESTAALPTLPPFSHFATSAAYAPSAPPSVAHPIPYDWRNWQSQQWRLTTLSHIIRETSSSVSSGDFSSADSPTGAQSNEATWRVLINNSYVPYPVIHKYAFGVQGSHPVVGDFDADGDDDLGVFVKGEWLLDLDGDRKWTRGDLLVRWGRAIDQVVVGDWDGDGKDDLALFGPSDHKISEQKVRKESPPQDAAEESPAKAASYDLRDKSTPNQAARADESTSHESLKRAAAARGAAVDRIFRLGEAGDWAIAGDWDGDGVDTVGVFRDGLWRLDVNGDGQFTAADREIQLGHRGDTPIVGDFNGDGVDEIGIFRDGQWRIDTNHDMRFDAHDAVFQLGGADDTPIVGDFNDDGVDDPAVFSCPVLPDLRVTNR